MIVPEGSFIKSMEMMPTQIRKRYFSEDDEVPGYLRNPKKFMRTFKDFETPYKEDRKIVFVN